jgi:proteic killer suppression protein
MGAVIQYKRVIKSFAEKRTRELFETGKSRRGNSIARVAIRKLVQIDSVTALDELNVPHGNRLESVSGDRAGQHSIRINDRWRICFRWETDGVYDGEIVDYH